SVPLPGSLQQQPGYQYELQVQESVTVQEGLCVHVPCSFSYPWSSWSSPSSLYTYWYRVRDNIDYAAPVASNNPHKPVKRETQGRFLLGDPRTNDCSLNITDARRSDSGRYFFRVERGNSVRYNYREKMLDLQVTDKPHIQILEPLESGRPTQLACSLPGSCERGQHFTFSWAGAAVDSLDPQIRRSSVLTFTPRPRDHGTSLTCQVQVQQPLLTSQRTIRLDVSYAPGNLTIGVSFRNDTEPLPALSTRAAGAAPCGAGGRGEFTCRAQHPLGSQLLSFSLSVQSCPPCRCVTEEQRGSWPLVLTLIRGALMGAGFLLTYVLTWLYYTRCGGPRSRRQSS
ncbi:PREDICTED: sialic acid-binding Ig-like lectin 14, partial [Myotis davidii]|uniref:sialic acid-binding Ig-like lectin 14 n=1 Tax=Myotis davidii TaxID=225400 RepID=UPI000766EA17